MNPKRTFAVLPLAIAILLAAGLFLDREDSANAQNSGHGARTTEGTTREASPQSGSASTPTDRDAFASVVAGPGGGRIQPSVFLDRSRVRAHAEEDLFALVSFEIPAATRAERDRPSLDLALVIDRSGSMSEAGKIGHAQEASFRLIDAMAQSDVLGVVEYDDEITVLWPASRLTSPQAIKTLIGQLEPRGSTNLAGGLFRGIDEVRREVRESGIHRVFLFSDGLANQGLTSPSEIAAVVRRARSHGITVSTLGLGLDYNEDLMQTIAEAGGGNYYYVESPSQMPSIFERELSTLFATVAKDVRLHFEFGSGVQEVQALGYDAVAENGSLVVPLENLYGGEKRTVLLRLRLDPRAPGRFDLGELRLRYTECEANIEEAISYQLRAEATEDLAAIEASIHPAASAEATLLSAEDEHEQAVRDYERGEKAEAKDGLAALTARIEEANAVLQDERLEKKLEQLRMESGDMDRADLSESNRQMYLKGSKNRLYNAKKGKRGQYLLQETDSGHEVEQLQRKLAELQIYSGEVDGVYSEAVRKAVEAYQGRNGLDADGIAGPATLRSLSLY